MNLATIIEGHPDGSVALVSREQVTRYGELRRQVDALRTGLVGLGVEPGDRLALVATNNWFFVVVHLAALGAGAVVVPLNPAGAPPELERELAAVAPRVAVVGPSGAAAFAGVDREVAPFEHLLVPDGAALDGGLPGASPLRALFEDVGQKGPAPVVERGEDDPAVLMFTSGTAGSPKAAVLTHGSLRSNLEQVQAQPGLALRPSDVALGVLPLFHIFGLNVVLHLSLLAGASVVLVERFDPVATMELVVRQGVTMVAGAPPIFAAWSTMAESQVSPATEATAGARAGVGVGGGGVSVSSALAGVRMAVSGGAPLSQAVASAFEARFGKPLWEGYGLTEASPIVTSTLAGVGGARARPVPGSIGAPLPGIEVRLVDTEGEDALEGDPGEIWVRGPNVFAGYWGEPEATREVLSEDGWLRTGDIAVADDAGELHLLDRAKDLIIVSGFNVFPAEVEDVLMHHPGVSEATVVGVAHPQSGEAVKAYVVAETGVHLEEDELVEFCAARLARYKCPAVVTFVEELPRGLVGKALRRALR